MPDHSTNAPTAPRELTDESAGVALVLAMQAGATRVNVRRPGDGRPLPATWPADPRGQQALAVAHVRGGPADVTLAIQGRAPERLHLDVTALASFVPRADGLCNFAAMDLDGPDHGAGGLIDPPHAARTVASVADAAGLGGGMLCAVSRGGRGRHFFLFTAAPVALADAVLVLGVLVAHAYRVATMDVLDFAGAHAFRTGRTGDGSIAKPGQAGALEMFPSASAAPPVGWPLALPAAGAFAARGGGIIVDPFTDRPLALRETPCADGENWRRFVSESRAELARRMPSKPASRPVAPRSASGRHVGTGRVLDPRTEAFLNGRTPEGERGNSAFASACALLGNGWTFHEVEAAIVAGGTAAGLSERECRTAVASAAGRLRRRGKL